MNLLTEVNLQPNMIEYIDTTILGGFCMYYVSQLSTLVDRFQR